MKPQVSQIPFVYACFGNAFDRILERGEILSKAEMRKRNLPFQRSTTSDEDLERMFGTEDDITLHPEVEFSRGYLYGGPLGPRIVFDLDLLRLPGSFMLPVDQNAYHPKNRGRYGVFTEFENDKKKTLTEMVALLESFVNSDQTIVPELHVKTRIPLGLVKCILVYTEDYKKYNSQLSKLGIEAVPFGKDALSLVKEKPGISLAEAYWGWRQQHG